VAATEAIAEGLLIAEGLSMTPEGEVTAEGEAGGEAVAPLTRATDQRPSFP
jgi:hypothetical protein